MLFPLCGGSLPAAQFGAVDNGLLHVRAQIHLTEADLWLEGAEGLASVLADGYTLTLYYDRSADEGGQVRLITAQ